MLSDKTYNFMKEITLVVLPAGGVLYFALSKIWGFPYGPEVQATIAAIDAFLGAVLHVSTNKYNEASSASDGYRYDDDEEEKEGE